MWQALAPIVRRNIDPLPVLRGMLPRPSARGLRVTSGAGHGRRPEDATELELAPLTGVRRATLWPYRPQRLPDELLCSWLWRVAHGLSAPPKRFAWDAIGVSLIDTDCDVNDSMLDRLAFLSGQSQEHLLRGTLRRDTREPLTERHALARRLILAHGALVLRRYRGGQCLGPIVQYCPVCLARGHTAYLRRDWRFSFEVACRYDGCLLLDRCWQCGAAVDPLAQAVPSDDFLCARCHARLPLAPSLDMDDLAVLQDTIYARIERLALFAAADGISPAATEYLTFLAESGLRGANPANVANRVAAVIEESRRDVEPDWPMRRHRSSRARRDPIGVPDTAVSQAPMPVPKRPPPRHRQPAPHREVPRPAPAADGSD